MHRVYRMFAMTVCYLLACLLDSPQARDVHCLGLLNDCRHGDDQTLGGCRSLGSALSRLHL